jgi:hypothetical protein
MTKTVKVKIAVSVDHNGEWSSAGWNTANPEELHSYTIDSLEPGERRYWMEAELELPAPTTVKPIITEAQP